MKLKMLTSLAGRDFSLSPGDEHEFGEAEGQRLVEAGYAEAVETQPKKTTKRGGKNFETAAVEVESEERA